jgi:hypothetical protein
MTISFSFQKGLVVYLESVGLIQEHWIQVDHWAIDFAYEPELGFAYSEFFREVPPTRSRHIHNGTLTIQTSPNMEGKRVWYPSLYELAHALIDHHRCNVCPDVDEMIWKQEWTSFLKRTI